MKGDVYYYPPEDRLKASSGLHGKAYLLFFKLLPNNQTAMGIGGRVAMSRFSMPSKFYQVRRIEMWNFVVFSCVVFFRFLPALLSMHASQDVAAQSSRQTLKH